MSHLGSQAMTGEEREAVLQARQEADRAYQVASAGLGTTSLPVVSVVLFFTEDSLLYNLIHSELNVWRP